MSTEAASLGDVLYSDIAEHWLERSHCRGLPLAAELKERLAEIARMLNGLNARESR